MKKLIALLLLLCLLPLCALAEMEGDGDVVVPLDGAEFFFTPIEGGHLLTRDSSASVFNRLGLSQREVLPSMEADGVYAILFDLARRAEIQILASPTDVRDYDEMTADELAQACEALCSRYECWDWQIETAEMYRAPDGHQYIKFIYYYTYEDGTVEYSVEYQTCQAGYSLMILVYPFGADAPTMEQIAQGEAIADSLRIKATE